MPKVLHPFFSLKAAGDFGAVLQYMCGHFVKAKPRVPKIRTPAQAVQRTKFSTGAQKWSEELEPEVKEHWNEYQEFISQLPQCEAFSFGIGGYDMWMSYFLKKGEDGWENYPDPPPT